MSVENESAKYEKDVRTELALILKVDTSKLERIKLQGFIHAYEEKSLSPHEAAKQIYGIAGKQIKDIFSKEKKLDQQLGI